MTIGLGLRESRSLSYNLAFNLADLTAIVRHEPILFGALIQPVLTKKVADFDNQAVCGVYALARVSQERANAIVDVIRIRIPRYGLRMKLVKHDRGKGDRWVVV